MRRVTRLLLAGAAASLCFGAGHAQEAAKSGYKPVAGPHTLNPGDWPAHYPFADETEAAIAASFTGVLDLTCCTSTYLADFIGARRRNALRTVQFPQPQKFDWAVRCAQLALQLLLDGQGDYLAARKRANDQLTQLVLETHARLRSPDL